MDVFLPNEREASRITGAEDLEEAARLLAEVVPLVVVKRGASGAMARRGTERFQASPVRVNPIDAVGAGDSFDAGFISQYIQGADVESCLAYDLVRSSCQGGQHSARVCCGGFPSGSLSASKIS